MAYWQVCDDNQTVTSLCISMASRASESVSSLPSKSSLENSKYLSPMIIVFIFISKETLFLMIISSFPNLSMLLSKLLAVLTLDFANLCIIFMVLRLNAKALESRPTLEAITPNTTFFLVFSITANRNLFCRVGRQCPKFLQNSSYLQLSFVTSPFAPKNLQHSSSKKDLSFGIFYKICDTLNALLLLAPFFCRKAIRPSASGLSSQLPNICFMVLPILFMLSAFQHSIYSLILFSFSIIQRFCFSSSAAESLPLSSIVLIFSFNQFTFQLPCLVDYLSIFRLSSDSSNSFLIFLSSSLSRLSSRELSAYCFNNLACKSSELHFSQFQDFSATYRFAASCYTSYLRVLTLPYKLLYCYLIFCFSVLSDSAAIISALFYNYKALYFCL